MHAEGVQVGWSAGLGGMQLLAHCVTRERGAAKRNLLRFVNHETNPLKEWTSNEACLGKELSDVSRSQQRFNVSIKQGSDATTRVLRRDIQKLNVAVWLVGKETRDASAVSGHECLK